MSPIINGLITVIISVAVMIAYNYFTANNTPPPVAVMPTDVPIGTMLPYAGKDIPAGWIACDNASYPTTTYPLLFSKIGYTYGTDDTKYRVPDTRGVFMRGMDATATRDANRPAGSIQLSGTVPDTNSVFTGASASATGGVGYVPAPLDGQQNYALTGNGKWRPSLMGSILQSVSTVRSAHRPGNTWTTVPDLSVLVTPISTDSQFLLTANITFSISDGGSTTVVFRFMRNSQPVGLGTGVVQNQPVGSFRASPSAGGYGGWAAKAIGDYLDAPATTNNITYTIQFVSYDTARLIYFNGIGRNDIWADNAICISTLTVQQC